MKNRLLHIENKVLVLNDNGENIRLAKHKKQFPDYKRKYLIISNKRDDGLVYLEIGDGNIFGFNTETLIIAIQNVERSFSNRVVKII